MENHLKYRPKKTIYPNSKTIKLRNEAIETIKKKLLPNDLIIKIILIGSSVKGSFGKYNPPGFRGSLYSDFDFIVFVKDNYQIPVWLNKEPDGKPFPDDSKNLAYRNRKLIQDKYDFEIFFIQETTMNVPSYQKLGEEAGIPMSEDSLHSHLIIYPD